MGTSTSKKVLVTRFDRETLPGFVNPQTWLSPDGLELLSTSGTVVLVPYAEIKTVSFVRDFEQDEPRREARLFASRPKMGGLWIRFHFRDGDLMDGILPNNLAQIDSHGFSIVPPDPGFQNQRIFIPKTALIEAMVLGVVGNPLRAAKKKTPAKTQIELFSQ